MPFMLRHHKNGKIGLVAICDVCRQPVRDAQAANIVWPTRKSTAELIDFKIVCRDECDRRLETMYKHTSWQPLDAGLVYLLENCGLRGKELDQAKQTAALLSNM